MVFHYFCATLNVCYSEFMFLGVWWLFVGAIGFKGVVVVVALDVWNFRGRCFLVRREMLTIAQERQLELSQTAR